LREAGEKASIRERRKSGNHGGAPFFLRLLAYFLERMRESPRIILRTPRRGTFIDEPVLVLEMGLGGAKFEHANRLDVGRSDTFSCGPLTTAGVVRHSVLLPAKTGIVYQTGISFPQVGTQEEELLMDLLVHEAQEQVREWEANLNGVGRESGGPRKPQRKSVVKARYLCLRLTPQGWWRTVTPDPNQPLDGVTVLDGTSEDELAVLCRTYEDADELMRELMRRVATVAILEGMRP